MVAVTEGILHVLDEDELEGVLAHELSHVKNRDVLIATVAATLAGAIIYLAQMAQWAAISGGSRRDDGRGGGNPVALLMMAILAPIAALLVQFAISRAREFQADASGAKLAGRTSGLGRALAKLAAASKTARLDAHPATAHLFIVNPLNGQALTRLFSTHPRSRSGLRGFARCAYEHARRPGDQPVSAKRPRGDTEMRTRWIAIAMMTVGLMLAPVMVGAQMAPGGGMGPMPGGMGMGGMMQMQGMMQQMQGMMQQMAEMMKAGAMSAEQTKRMGEVMEEMTGAMGEMHGMMSPRGPGARDPRAMHEQMARMQQRMAEMQKHMAEMMGKMPGAPPGASAPEKK